MPYQIGQKSHAKMLFLFIAQSSMYLLAGNIAAESLYDDRVHFPRSEIDNDLQLQALPLKFGNENHLGHSSVTEMDRIQHFRMFQFNVSRAITGFGLKLLKEIPPEGNVVLSPFSVATSLAVIQQGARSKTRRQISIALGMYPDKSTRGFWKIYTHLNSLKDPRSPNRLSVASAIFVHNSQTDQFDMNEKFNKRVHNSFNTSVIPANFDLVESATQVVNKWVEKQTNGFIRELLTEDSISQNTRLVLANAVFFKGQWEIPFDHRMTDERDFHLANGETKRTQFMHCAGKHRAGVLSKREGGATFIVKPFEGGQYSFMGILPSQKSNLDELLVSINETSLLEKLTKMPLRETKLTLPKFAIQKQFDLQSILKQMGVTEIFSEYADLSDIGTYRGSSPILTTAVHNAAMIVDEKGATGVAATAFGVSLLSAVDRTVYFWADRPFLAILWDATNAVPLFMARIEDPTIL